LRNKRARLYSTCCTSVDFIAHFPQVEIWIEYWKKLLRILEHIGILGSLDIDGALVIQIHCASMAAINNIGERCLNSHILVFHVTAGHRLVDGYSEGVIMFLPNFNPHTLHYMVPLP
jgi:hypothetical protein